MPKRVSVHDWQRGFDVIYGEWYSVNPCDCEADYEIRLHARIPNPEQILLRKEAWENLSTEAKEIIEVILDSPAEILEMLKTPKRRLLTKRSIRKYFRSRWNSKFIADMTIKEISVWANQL